MRYFFISLSIFVLISNFCSSEVITYNYSDGAKYTGEIVDGEKNGYGIYKWSDGGFYKGQFENGTFEGYGELYWNEGDIYRGQFENGECAGAGKLIKSDEIYFGGIKECNMHGYGKLIFLGNSSTYWGAFEDGNINGLGYMETPEYKYFGSWKKNKRHGSGLYLNIDTLDLWFGEFVNGELDDGQWISDSEFKLWFSRLEEKGNKMKNDTEKYVNEIINSLKIVELVVSEAELASDTCHQNMKLQSKLLVENKNEELINAAKGFLTLCSKQRPENIIDAYFSQFIGLESLKKYEEMIYLADRCIKKNNNYNICLSQKGIALYNLERYAESKKTFEEALEVGSFDKLSELAVKEATKWLKIIEKGEVLN